MKNLVAVSDLHCGCQLGLCPPKGFMLDSGGYYTPNAIQKKMWSHWVEFFTKWVPAVTHGEKWSLIVNGDLIDGSHHGTVSQVSHNITDQIKIAVACLSWVKKLPNIESIYVTRGTPVHGGQSGQSEEIIAEEIGAVKIDGVRSHYELWLTVGKGLVHATHHIGTTGSMAYESSALMSELVASYNEAGRWQRRAPDAVLRSHRHRCITVKVPTANTAGIAVTTPGWQAKTSFAYKIAGARQSEPQFGGVLFRYGHEDGLYVRERVWSVPPAKPVHS